MMTSRPFGPRPAASRRRGRTPSTGRGSVTAEFAVVLPAVTALLALLLLGAGAGILQLRLEEGARAGARALARGESSARAADIARDLSGGAGVVSVDLAGGYATVTLTGRVSGPLAAMMPWQQSARASARLEGNGPKPGASAGQRPEWPVPRRKSTLWRWVHLPAAAATVATSVRANGWTGYAACVETVPEKSASLDPSPLLMERESAGSPHAGGIERGGPPMAGLPPGGGRHG